MPCQRCTRQQTIANYEQNRATPLHPSNFGHYQLGGRNLKTMVLLFNRKLQKSFTQKHGNTSIMSARSFASEKQLIALIPVKVFALNLFMVKILHLKNVYSKAHNGFKYHFCSILGNFIQFSKAQRLSSWLLHK